jgi:tetratricopeptide (TPR) repeat protein
VNQFLQEMLASSSRLVFDPSKLTVAKMLEASEPLMERRWKDDPATKAALDRSLGAGYFGLHQLDRGKKHLEAALTTFRSLGDDREIAQTLASLSGIEAEAGHIENGVTDLDEAMLHVKRLGKGAPADLIFDVQVRLASLLTLYLHRRVPECRTMLNNAIELAKRDSSISRTDLASAMNLLGGIYGEEGKYAEAESLILASLDVGRKEDPGGTWESEPMYSMYIYRGRQGDAAGSTEWARRRVETVARNLGDDHLYTATSRMMWARGLSETGQLDEALRQVDAAMPVIRKAYQAPNPNLWTPVISAAHVFIKAGQFDKAESCAREAIVCVEGEGLPEADPRRAESLYHLGIALHGQKRDVDAVQVLERALNCYRGSGPAFAKSVDRVQGMLDSIVRK